MAITQQSQWYFGQSWPGLIYMPYLAFVGSTVRHNLGFGLGMSEFIDLVGPHEFAHQWWGHQIGWASYHDQWLSEGFAEFSAALVLQVTKGPKAYNDFWDKRRKQIFERSTRATITNDVAGPITQGGRLSTWQARGAYQTIVYEKGAYVLHMLRMLMSDPKKQNHDEDFIAMMTDFAKTYAGKNPSTADFENIVQKHAPALMKITKDGTSTTSSSSGSTAPTRQSSLAISRPPTRVVGSTTSAAPSFSPRCRMISRRSSRSTSRSKKVRSQSWAARC